MNWQIIVGVLFILSGLCAIISDFFSAIITLAIGGTLLYWGLKKKGTIKRAKASNGSDRTLKEEVFHAVGVHYYEDSFQKLANSNPDWNLFPAKIIESGKAGKKIYQHFYINKPVKLEREPKNEHDRNAVAIIIAGEKVGYISREENVHVAEILAQHEIKSLSAFIGGGKYKIVSDDGSVHEFHVDHTVNVKIKYV